MISIIIPIYNQADKLAECLESILAQSYRDIEVILVDDGSIDNPVRVARAYEGKMVLQYLELPKNSGAPAARNTGWRVSKGEYLFFCDADATLAPTALADLFGALEENPAASFAYSNFTWGKREWRIGKFDANRLRKGPMIHTMSLIRRTDFPPVGWDESIKKFQDWDLYLTMAEEGRVGVWVDKILFNVKPGGTMSNWLPILAYKLLPFLPAVRKYNRAKKVIIKKHHLD